MRILLTGGSGFLGSALAARWSANGHFVTALLRPHSDAARLGLLNTSIEIIRVAGQGDLTDAVAGSAADVVVHASGSYGRRSESIADIIDANLRFGAMVLEASMQIAPVPAFVNTGTALEPGLGAYALSKHQFAEWGRQVAEDRRSTFVNVRLQHLYGPGDDESKFTARVMQACLRGEPELRLTSGEQRRDFLYLDDAVSAYEAIIASLHTWSGYHEIDVGTGDARPVREFVETVHRLSRSTTKLLFGAVPYRPAESMLYRADVTCLRSLGWRQGVEQDEGIDRMIRHAIGSPGASNPVAA